jgi:hypothetical protein
MSANLHRRRAQHGAGTYDVPSTLDALVEQDNSCREIRVLRKEPVERCGTIRQLFCNYRG